MNHLLLLPLLMINVVPTISTIRGLYQIGRDGINSTLNTAIELPGRFLQGYTENIDLPSKAILDGIGRTLKIIQKFINVILDLVFTPLNLLIYPVDAVVEGTLNMIPFVRIIAQLMDRVIFGFNDHQGHAGKILSDSSQRIGQKLSQSRTIPEPRGMSATLTVFIGNSTIEINNEIVLSLYNMFVSSAESSIATLPEVITLARMTSSKQSVAEPSLKDADLNLNKSLVIMANITDSLSPPNENASHAAKLLRKDIHKIMLSMGFTNTFATAKNVSRAITSSVLLLNELVLSEVDTGTLNNFYTTLITGLINAVGSVSLKIYFSSESSAEMQNFLQVALKPLNLNDSIAETCRKIDG
ncbi:uncharacterized protein LOC100908061 [Galendromus occidentalis]|uniref:Uncharacterized protein LOC100908061 n=1 Tax=Galendromus occidentalis TaxID=34638 RepID=A0AAJ6QNH8_9ACAR|nr:uncharacterized protein LOC100908061 [Galendromus occidentalis]